MIPVRPQPEPDGFDCKVRRPGLKWLAEHHIDPNNSPPDVSVLPALWTYSNKRLWEAYSGICAYLAIYFEFVTGASSTDHFIAKSKNAGLAYEWNNYRLSCLGANRNKNNFDDVLDPFEIVSRTFFIKFVSGKIYPNPILSPEEKNAAIKTIERLKLGSPENNAMRAGHYHNYINGDCSLRYLERYSPFVYAEIIRQELI
jgi:uncharacterized protein (TIGR02646 family)